jgi:hypothetical protein
MSSVRPELTTVCGPNGVFAVNEFPTLASFDSAMAGYERAGASCAMAGYINVVAGIVMPHARLDQRFIVVFPVYVRIHLI